MIYISQAAAREIKRLKQIRQQPENSIRLSIENGGCSGLFYNLELDNPSSQTNVSEQGEGDRVWESNGVTVIVDERAYPHVHGLKLDYSEDLMGGGFRFQNPNAIEPCKCSLSFRTTKILEQPS
ncbi:MAG: iron-sulfur cluster assembly accessory protein [Xenococcaceae cyanobacterium MO_188.B32]|nr:iron-sulfur cluster assembly accessory protein [Xenococcaceae cyanobacterium MO_188.B32]